VGSRGKKWHSAVSGREWYYKIIEDNLSFSNSLAVECRLIKQSKDLVNSVIPNEVPQDYKDLGKIFRVDSASLTGLYWIKWVDKRLKSPVIETNKEVGHLRFTKGVKSSIQVLVNGRSLQVHRIIWFLIHGSLPSVDMIIDHIDGDPHNNKIENLRLVSHKTNCENLSKYSNNSTGVSGVYLRKKRKYFAGSVSIKGTVKNKHFSINKYGEEGAFRLACEYRAKMITELNLQGAGYTERHGT